MNDENFEQENEGTIEIPSRMINHDSENEEMNPSEEEDFATQSKPISQSIMKEEPDLKEFKLIEKTDKNKLKFSYLTRFFQKFSELKGRKKTEYIFK